MKRYLISGAMALAFCSMFVGCSDDDEWMSYADAKVQAFDEAFTKIYGQIDPRQDWGFGNYATTRAANTNGNQWHDPAYFNLAYDAKVTIDEMNKVFNYVNDTTNVRTVDQIPYTDYWVTQIWEGDVNKNADNVMAPVSHSYPNQNGAITDIIGGAQMDKLMIKESADGNWIHCNNFNNATNGNYKEGGEGGRTLMLNSGTYSFGYTNSQASYFSEKYIIVPGENIHSSLAGFYYVCFDFERGYTDAELAQEKTMGTYEAWNGNNYQGGWNFTLDGNLNEDQVKAAIGQQNGRDIQNIKIKGYLYGDKHCDGDGNYTDWIVRISPAKQNLQKGNVLLVKEENGEYTGTVEYRREGKVTRGRIFCEDLARDDYGDIDFNDAVFDAYIYDTEVFKVMKKKDGTQIGEESDGKDQFTKIDVLACGGTLPLTVAGTEVHSLFGQSTTTMINTIGENSILSTTQGYNPQELRTIERAPYFESLSAINVAVKVNDTEVQVLNNASDLGAVPHMICVPLGTPWPQERVAIGPEAGSSNTADCAFRDFAKYVGDASVNPWESINEGKVYDEWNPKPENTERVIQINEIFREAKDTTYTGTIKTEYTVEVTQAIPTPEGTVVYTGHHQFKDGGDGTDLIIQANDFSNAGLAIGKKLRIYGVGYEGQHKDGTGWKLYISGVGDWMTPSTNPELKSQGYIEIDITSNNLDIFRRTVTIQGQAFNILAITVI